MKRILFFIALLFTLGASAQTYNPVNGTLSNKPYAPAQAVPTDMRSFYYDSAIFTFRAYQDTIEVLSYLNLPKWRGGNYLIYVHSGGVLNANGTYTGGTIAPWWFKDGVADSNLVPFSVAGGGGSGGPGISSVTAINGLSNVNDSTVKWGGNPLIENTHIRGDNFSLTIDSLKSFIVSSYPNNRAFFGFDTANVIITGKGINAPSASLQLLPNNPLTYGSSSLGTARLIGTTGADAQILEVNGSAISFGHSGASQPAKIFLKYSDSLQVDSIAKVAVWDSDTLKSADISEIIAGGIDSIFITQTDSIFIISGNDTIFVGVIDNIRDTADLVQGYGIYINNADSTYSPNGFDVLIAVDTSRIATKYELSIITNSDTAIFIVDSIANAPTGSEPPNTKYLVGTSPTGVFATHANDIAELIGAVWTFTDPTAQQQLIVDNAITYASYQYDGAVWNQTTVLWRVNGNTALGQTAFLGKISKERMPFRSWNKEFMYGDTTRDVYLPKLINTPSFNYLRIDSLTGRIDTAMFRSLIAGTNITITPGPVGDTIKSTGGAGTTNSLTFNNSGSGDASGTSFNGSVARTLSYNSIGAMGVLTTTGTSGAATYTAATGTLNIPQYATTPAGNYNNIQLNRNSVFATPASDSLTWSNTYGLLTPFQFSSRSSIAAGTLSNGLLLANTGIATNNNQMWSKGISFIGSGWKTTATAAAQAVQADLYLTPVQGTTLPSAAMELDFTVNGNPVSQGLLRVGGAEIGYNQSLNDTYIGGPGNGSVSLFSVANRALQVWPGRVVATGTYGISFIAATKLSSYGPTMSGDNTTLSTIVDFTIAGTPTNNQIWTGYRFASPDLTGSGTYYLASFTGGNVGFGTVTPAYQVDVSGTTRTSGFMTGFASTATGITLNATHFTVEVTATGQTITLPTAVSATGRIYVVKLTASGSATVATTSSQTIDGSTTYSLSAQYKYVRVQSNGSNWIIIGNN